MSAPTRMIPRELPSVRSARHVALGVLVAAGAAHAQPGSAALTDSTYLTTLNTRTLNPQHFTLEAWIRPDGPGYGNSNDVNGATIVGKPRATQGGNFIFSWTMQWAPVTRKLNFSLSENGGDLGFRLDSQALVQPGVPTHVAATFDGSTMRLYINGVLDASRAAAPSSVYYNTVDPVLIGAGNYCCGYLRRWQGLLDDVRIWDEARTQEQIAQNMQCGLEAGPQPGLLARWVFDDGAALDVSGNGRHAQFADGPAAFGADMAGVPAAGVGPADRVVCPSGSGVLEVVPSGSTPHVFEWQLEDADAPGGWRTVVDGPLVLGSVIWGTLADAESAALRVTPDPAGYAVAPRLRFRAIVSNPCGEFASRAAALVVCATDINCDGVVDFFDYLDFAAAFDAENLSADFNGDQQVDFFDYLDFVSAFDAGCE